MTEKEKSGWQEIVDRWFSNSGIFRRRFSAGLATVLPLAVVFNDIEVIAKTIQGLTAPIALLGIALAIYTIGALVELFSALYLMRAVSAGYQTYADCQDEIHSLHTRISNAIAWYKIPWRLVLYLYIFWLLVTMIFRVLFASVGGFLSVERESPPRDFPLEQKLSTPARDFVTSLPPLVRQGLLNPFGDKRELGIDYLRRRVLPESESSYSNDAINAFRETSLVGVAIAFSAFVVSISLFPTVMTATPASTIGGNSIEYLQTVVADYRSQVPNWKELNSELHSEEKAWLHAQESQWNLLFSNIQGRSERLFSASKFFEFPEMDASSIENSDLDNLLYALSAPWPSGIAGKYPEVDKNASLIPRMMYESYTRSAGSTVLFITVVGFWLAVTFGLPGLVVLGIARHIEVVTVNAIEAATIERTHAVSDIEGQR